MDKDTLKKTAGHGAEEDLLEDAALDALFATARDTDPMPSPELMQRVMSDAMGVQVLQHSQPAAAQQTQSLWRGMLAALGGWPALAGLATACVAGVWVGVNPPDLISDSAATFLALETDGYMVDVMPTFSVDFDAAQAEG
jgi:hypothetical protein